MMGLSFLFEQFIGYFNGVTHQSGTNRLEQA